MMTASRLFFSMTALAAAMHLTACSNPAEVKKESADTTAETTSTGGEKIRIASEGAYPPMNFTKADGTLAGFDIDVANALCEQMKADCEIVAQDWDGIIQGLQAKKYDAIIAGMSITPKRLEVVDFTDPYFSSGLILIAKADSDINPDSLKDVTIGAQRSTVAAEFIETNYPKVTVKLYDTQENANSDLTTGRLQAVLVDQVVGTDWLSSDDAKGYVQKGASISTGKDDMGIALRKDDPLVEKFNAALAEIKSNGKYNAINAQYFGGGEAGVVTEELVSEPVPEDAKPDAQ